MEADHTDFQHTNSRNLCYIMILNVIEDTSLWVCQGSHRFVDYFREAKKEPRKLLKIVDVEIDLHAVFGGHNYLQQAKGWEGKV